VEEEECDEQHQVGVDVGVHCYHFDQHAAEELPALVFDQFTLNFSLPVVHSIIIQVPIIIRNTVCTCAEFMFRLMLEFLEFVVF